MHTLFRTNTQGNALSLSHTHTHRLTCLSTRAHSRTFKEKRTTRLYTDITSIFHFISLCLSFLENCKYTFIENNLLFFCLLSLSVSLCLSLSLSVSLCLSLSLSVSLCLSLSLSVTACNAAHSHSHPLTHAHTFSTSLSPRLLFSQTCFETCGTRRRFSHSKRPALIFTSFGHRGKKQILFMK